jgi:hypothetical protein
MVRSICDRISQLGFETAFSDRRICLNQVQTAPAAATSFPVPNPLQKGMENAEALGSIGHSI